MNELIPVSQSAIDGQEVQTVDARALHAFLEVKRDFSTWLKERIEKYGFTENVDFIVFPGIGENSEGRPRIDYALTLDMGKQLAMVENNEKGRQARLYFIDCERRALKDSGHSEPSSPKPRRSESELNARSAAVSFRMMARMDVYPKEMRAVFAAKSAALLTGEPLAGLLPPVAENRETWQSPTAIGELLGKSDQAVGKGLKALGLHGDDDPAHRHSQPLWNKSPHGSKEVISFVYAPAVITALREFFSGLGEPAQEPH